MSQFSLNHSTRSDAADVKLSSNSCPHTVRVHAVSVIAELKHFLMKISASVGRFVSVDESLKLVKTDHKWKQNSS